MNFLHKLFKDLWSEGEGTSDLRAQQSFRELSEDDLVKLATSLRRSSMDTIVLFALEASKPLSFVLSQAMIAFEPLVGVAFDTTPYMKIAYLLADRDKVERLLKLLEEPEAQSEISESSENTESSKDRIDNSHEDRRDKDESRVQG